MTKKLFIIFGFFVVLLFVSFYLEQYHLYPVSSDVLHVSEQIATSSYNISCFDWREIEFNLLLNENKVNIILDSYTKNCDFDEITISLCIYDLYKNFGEIEYSGNAYTKHSYPVNYLGETFKESGCLRLRLYGNETSKNSAIIINLNATLDNTFYNKYKFKSEDVRRSILNIVYSEFVYDTDSGSFSILRGDIEENGNIDILHSEPVPSLATKTYKYSGEDIKVRFRPQNKLIEMLKDFFFALSISILGGVFLFFVSKSRSTHKSYFKHNSKKLSMKDSEDSDITDSVIYKESLNSARHHDNLLWNVTSIIIAANVILLGLVINNISPNCQTNLITSFVVVFAIILSVSLIYLAYDFRRLKKFHYKNANEKAEKINKDLIPERGYQWFVYLFIMIALIILWLIILFKLLCPCFF